MPPVIFSGKILFGGSQLDIAYSVKQTADGGYIVAGQSNSTNGDLSGGDAEGNYWIVKLLNDGKIEGEIDIGGITSEIAYAIEQTKAGDYIINGYSYSYNSIDVTGHHGAVGIPDYWIVLLKENFWKSDRNSAADNYVLTEAASGTTPDSKLISIYPNPSTGNMTIDYAANKAGQA